MKWSRQTPRYKYLQLVWAVGGLLVPTIFQLLHQQDCSRVLHCPLQTVTYVVSWMIQSSYTSPWRMRRRKINTESDSYRLSSLLDPSPIRLNLILQCKSKNDGDDNDNNIEHQRRSTNKRTQFRIGDKVFVPRARQVGTIYSKQKNGWYTIEFIEVVNNQNSLLSALATTEFGIKDTVKKINFKKCRTSQIQLLDELQLSEGTKSPNNVLIQKSNDDDRESRNVTSSNNYNNSESTTTAPTILNLDELLLSCQNKSNTGGTSLLSNQQEWDIEQLQYFQSMQEWVVFSDLHCSIYTIETCLEVLQHVHNIAKQQPRRTGIIFLGDFWHIRSHNIRLDLYSQIMQLFQQSYTVPLIFIPGNHDLLSSSSSNFHSNTSYLHSLLPFQNAYRIQQASTTTSSLLPSINGVLILSQPTIFMNALFIPYIRNPAVMERILRDIQDYDDIRRNVRIVLCHVDVTGASMNDNIVSQGGISIQCFPPNIPIYSGHFHKPHNVTSYRRSTGSRRVDSFSEESVSTSSVDDIRRVEYIGSPYQVSLSESEQKKGIIVLNNTNWVCMQRIPLHIGRRHFRLTTLSELFALKIMSTNTSVDAFQSDTKFVRFGDRIVLTINKHAMDDVRVIPNEASKLDEHISHLRNSGIFVEIREISEKRSTSAALSVPNDKSISSSDAIVMSPMTLWAAFIAHEVQRGAVSQANEETILTKGKEILEEVGNMGILNTVTGAAAAMRNTQHNDDGKAVNFQLFSVTLRGFGPFRDEVSYPLFNRGLVLLRGSNKDGGSDSNGSGKTSLAMSILWALTGSVDPRPMQDSKVSDVINDSAKAAIVTIEGALYGKKFSICRTKTFIKGSLSFVFDDVDLTRQAIKDTQDVINEKLGINSQLLARTMFNGQHALNELLESSDTKLKEELALVVPLTIWHEALRQSRAKLRDAQKRIAELDGKISIRSNDANVFRLRLEEAESNYKTELHIFEESTKLLNEEIEFIRASSMAPSTDQDATVVTISSSEETLLEADRKLINLEKDIESLNKQQESDLDLSMQEINKLIVEVASLDENLRVLELERNELMLQQALSKQHIKQLQDMWKLDLSCGIPNSLILPRHCPTCHQPMPSVANISEQVDIGSIVLEEITSSMNRSSQEQKKLLTIQDCIKQANASKMSRLDDIHILQDIADKKRCSWDEKIQDVQRRLQEAKTVQQAAAVQFTQAAKQLDCESKVASLQGRLNNAIEKLEQNVNRLNVTQMDLNDCERQISEFNLERLYNVDVARVMSDLCDKFGPKGIQTFVMEGAVATLEFTTQTYLDELSDETQRMELTLDSGDCIARKAYVRGENGVFKERALASLSGGQWRRCSLAFTLAFASLVANRANFRPSLLVLDEPLTHLDQSGRSNVGRLIRKFLCRESEHYHDDGSMTNRPSFLGFQLSTILIILQDLAAEELEESFDAIDEVSKQSGYSTVYVDN